MHLPGMPQPWFCTSYTLLPFYWALANRSGHQKSMYQPSFFSCCQKNLFCHGNIYPILPYRSPGTAHHDPCAGITNQRCIRKSQFFRLGTRCVKHTPRRQHDTYPSVFCFPYNILGKSESDISSWRRVPSRSIAAILIFIQFLLYMPSSIRYNSMYLL